MHFVGMCLIAGGIYQFYEQMLFVMPLFLLYFFGWFVLYKYGLYFRSRIEKVRWSQNKLRGCNILAGNRYFL
jgi:hypothetical protein